MNDNEDIVFKVIEMLNTSIDASIQLMQQIYSNNINVVDVLITDLSDVFKIIHSNKDEIINNLEHTYIAEMTDNVIDTINDIKSDLEKNNVENSMFLIEFQLIPFIRILKESLYFWCSIYPNKDKIDKYYENEFAHNYRNMYYEDDVNSKYKISIVIPAYNHLETTKKCVEHVLRYIDFSKLNAELILIDHGSSDGTLEYFKTVENAKIIHFKNNVRMYMFCMLPMVCESEYANLVSNDILVTSGYIENLINCLESDNNIAMAVPMTPNISNLQMISVPTNKPDAFVKWANSFNKSNPLLWSDRARLMPPTCVYRMSIIQELGLADPHFYSMEFWDDDFSTRVRRKGYRQVLCEDTACYHFGSVTGKEAQKNEGTLQYGRKLFEKKYEVDPWGLGCCYDYTSIKIMKKYIDRIKSAKVLAIDCGFGDTPLQIKNEFRHLNKDCEIYNLTIQHEYAKDLQPLSDYFEYHNQNISIALKNAFNNTKFDIIYIGRSLSDYSDFKELLIETKNKLADDGVLLCTNRNPSYILNLYFMMQFKLPESKMNLLDSTKLYELMNSLFINVSNISSKNEIKGTDSFVKKHYSEYSEIDQQKIIEKLSVKTEYFICES